MKQRVFRVYRLDMYLNEDNQWTENERFLLGKMHVPMADDGSVNDEDILKAATKFRCFDHTGRQTQILNTTDRRRVYIDDMSGDGLWLEIGAVKGRVPCYALENCGGVA